MSSFGTPTFGAPVTGTPQPQHANGVAQTQPSDAPVVVVDENDPRLVSEVLTVNPAGDAFAAPPPPPDGVYRAILHLEGFTDQQTQQKKDYGATMTKGSGGNPPLPYFATGISAKIQDPSGKYDGITVYPPFGGNVGTLVSKDGSSKVSTILFKLKAANGMTWGQIGNEKKIEVPGRGLVGPTQLTWIQTMVECARSEPECGIVTQWEWSCQECGEAAKATGARYPKGIQGMKYFPLEPNKEKVKANGHPYVPEMKCTAVAGHGVGRARVVIVRFLSLEELAEAQRTGMVR